MKLKKLALVNERAKSCDDLLGNIENYKLLDPGMNLLIK